MPYPNCLTDYAYWKNLGTQIEETSDITAQLEPTAYALKTKFRHFPPRE
jgi:hypothetical protein